jgi:hypothetical protein
VIEYRTTVSAAATPASRAALALVSSLKLFSVGIRGWKSGER